MLHNVNPPIALGSTIEVGDEITGNSSQMGSQVGQHITKPKNVLM